MVNSDTLVSKAASLGVPLTGGKALAFYSYLFQYPYGRDSEDFDFVISSVKTLESFASWLKSNVDPDTLKVDCMWVESHDYSKYIRRIHGIFVMDPAYILWTKLQRASEKDLIDIKWILSLPETILTSFHIEKVLGELGVTETEANLLNSLL